MRCEEGRPGPLRPVQSSSTTMPMTCRQHHRARRRATVLAAVLLTACTTVAAQGEGGALPFQELVVFGDSLSDDATHGSWQFSNQTWPADPAYYDGRFSNGPVWAEYVAQHFELTLKNFAAGGATSDNDLVQGKTGANGEVNVPALVDQVDEYLADEHHSGRMHKTLFVMLIGANDIFFLPEVHGFQVTEKVDVAIQRLRAHGGYAFLLGVPYSLSATAYSHSPATAPPAERLHAFEAYSSALRRDLTRLRIRLASREFKLQVAVLDFHALFHHIVAKPSMYGLDAKTINEPCLRGTYGDTEARTVCDQPDRRLWWDMARIPHSAETGNLRASRRRQRAPLIADATALDSSPFRFRCVGLALVAASPADPQQCGALSQRPSGGPGSSAHTLQSNVLSRSLVAVTSCCTPAGATRTQHAAGHLAPVVKAQNGAQDAFTSTAMLRIDPRSPFRPPSRSDPSPISARHDISEMAPKSATADSPLSSRFSSAGPVAVQPFTSQQTSALGKLARLAGVRADQAQPGGPSTADMLERAVAIAENDNEVNEHVKLQPPTPSPALGGGYVASPGIEEQAASTRTRTASTASSVSPTQYRPLSQGPVPESPSYPYAPPSQIGTSSSSASLHHFSPYSPYTQQGFEQSPHAQQSGYAFGYAPAYYYPQQPGLSIDQLATTTTPALGFVVPDTRLSSPISGASPILPQQHDGSFMTVSPHQPNQYLQQQTSIYYYGGAVGGGAPGTGDASDYHSPEPSPAPHEAASTHSPYYHHPSAPYSQHPQPHQHLAYYGMPATTGAFQQPFYGGHAPMYASQQHQQQYEAALRRGGGGPSSLAQSQHGHFPPSLQQASQATYTAAPPPELARGHLAQSRLHDAAYNRPPPLRRAAGGPQARSALPRPPPHSEHALWVGNVPGDSNHAELWRFFTSRSGPAGPGSSTGVESIHLISRSNCAFVNYASNAHLEHAIRTCHGVSLRPGDPRCKDLVCRVRRKDDDAKSGVGAQRGRGMHQAYVRDQENAVAAASGLPQSLPTHTRLPSTGEPLSPLSKGSSTGTGPDQSHSVSTASTTSSFLTRHFRKRFFILKSHTEDDLRLSQERGMWATQPHNEPVLDQAFRTAADGVFLIFSANKSGEFFGYARMTGPVFVTPDDALRAASGSGSGSTRGLLAGADGHRTAASISGRTDFAASPKPIESASGSPAIATSTQTSFLLPSASAFPRGVSDPTPRLAPDSDEQASARGSAPSGVPASVLSAWSQLNLGPSHSASNDAVTDGDGITRRDTAMTPEERNARLEQLAEADDEAGIAATAQIQRASAPAVTPTVAAATSQLSVPGSQPAAAGSEGRQTIAAGGSGSSFGPGWGRPFKVEWLSSQRLPFSRTRHLRNGFNANREVRVARDGTEVEPTCGDNVLREFGRATTFPSPPIP